MDDSVKRKKFAEMITLERAFEIVLGSSFSTGTESVPFTHSLNRILAADITSDVDMPPFNKATVDGFACKRSDLGSELEVIETIPAGKWPERTPGRMQCSRIMTGAAVPEQCDCVIMVEDTEIVADERIRFTGKFTKENISVKGEDVRKGDIVLKAGCMIKPQDIAIMASVGSTAVTVGKMPEIGVISTGSELVEPFAVPGISGIRNSNSWQLMALIARAGAKGRYYGIAKDDEEETYKLISQAITENQIVLITGGVSMGDFDFVPGVLERAGVRILFTRIAVQPGKPTTFGVLPGSLVFGLPGNPVSAFVQFEILVRPLINKMMGFDRSPYKMSLPMGIEFTRKYSERKALIPVKVTADNEVVPVDYHGSAHISSLHSADGIIEMPIGVNLLRKGEVVSVRQI